VVFRGRGALRYHRVTDRAERRRQNTAGLNAPRKDGWALFLHRTLAADFVAGEWCRMAPADYVEGDERQAKAQHYSVLVAPAGFVAGDHTAQSARELPAVRLRCTRWTRPGE
jgi:hypothetical protein